MMTWIQCTCISQVQYHNHIHYVHKQGCPWVNRLRLRQNGHHFVDDTFNRIFVNENVRILIKFSLKFVPNGPVNNIPALVQMMAWRRPGDKPLSETSDGYSTDT